MADPNTGTLASGDLEAAIVAASNERGEPEWLRERRIEAARAFEATPLPTPALRPWKYMDLSGLDLDAFAPAKASITVEGEMPGGFAGTLADGLAAHDDVVRTHLGSVVPATEGKFQALNGARWEDGVFVYGPRRAEDGAPVHVTIDAPAGSVAPRLLIVAEERAEVTVVLRLQSAADAEVLAAGVTEIVAGQGSKVLLLIDDRWGARTRDFSTIRSRLARDANVRVVVLALGGLIFKQQIDALIEGEGANSEIRGVALGDAQQHFDFVTLQDHGGAHSTSNVEIKAALAGASRSVYYGITRVEVTAKQASAEQENRNLLLSEHAKADSDPVLEILTSDVIRCGHGATVGPVDQEALFYLQSRGLDRRHALQLLVAGFFQSAIGDLPLEEVAEGLEARVIEKLQVAEL